MIVKQPQSREKTVNHASQTDATSQVVKLVESYFFFLLTSSLQSVHSSVSRTMSCSVREGVKHDSASYSETALNMSVVVMAAQ